MSIKAGDYYYTQDNSLVTVLDPNPEWAKDVGKAGHVHVQVKSEVWENGYSFSKEDLIPIWKVESGLATNKRK